MVGLAISYSKKFLIFPPTHKNCPDYWTEGDGTAGNASPGFCLYPPTSTDRNRGSSDFTNARSPANNTLPSDNDFKNISNNYIGLDQLGFISYNHDGTVIGNLTNPATDATDITKLFIQMNNNDASWNTIYSNTYAGLTARCAKRKWAIENGIVWDGITNYNGCS